MIAPLRKSHGASRTLTRPIGRKTARIIAFFICGQVSLAVVPRNAEASATLSVNPSSFIFGNVPVGSASYQAFTLTNSGSVAITISNATAAGTGFGVGGRTFPLTLAPGGSCTLIAGFAPTSQGLTVGVMWIVSPQMSSPLAIMMVGSGLGGAPVIMTQPASQSVFVGHTATFSITASETAPLTYQWRKNGIAIAGATGPTYTTPLTTSSDNGEKFTVVVSDSGGSITSTTAVLTVNALVAPSITTQPVGHTITAGQAATFSVVAYGTAPLAYQWRKNGVAIIGATSPSYTTPSTTSSNNGAQFTVVVSNSAGSVMSNAAILAVNPDPVWPSITAQPASKTISAGQTAAFSVTASGTAPLAYQWKKNGVAISGATSSSYTAPAEATSDSGALFTVVVSNTAGSVTSSAAILTVIPVPGPLSASTSTLNFGSVNIESTDALSVTFTNPGGSNITVSNVIVAGPGFTVSGMSAGLIVSAGKSATLNATFSPTVTGSVTGSVSVVSSASNSPASISLSGAGLQPIHSVSLNWSPSTSTVVGYNVYRGTNSAGPYSKISSMDATTTFTDTTVQAGQTYCWVVTAVNSNNQESVYSSDVSATIPTP